MTAAAVYRYFPSRNNIDTTLIVDADDSLCDAINVAGTVFDRGDLGGRLVTMARAYRSWP